MARRLVPPVATGVLAALAFPPVDLGPLVLIAPVPLFVAWWRAPRVRAAALDGFVAGVVFFGITLVWVWWFGVVAYVPFMLTLAAYWAGAGAVTAAFARRGAANAWVVASAWVVFEALRGRWPLGGFSWAELGYALHDVPAARSVSGFGGVLLVSFLVALAAAFLARGWIEWQEGDRARLRRAGAAVVGILVAAVLAQALLPATTPSESLRVAVIQGNDKNRELTAAEVGERYLPRSHFELARGLDPTSNLDLVVLPESSLDEDPRIDPFLEGVIGDLARQHGAAVVANAAVEIDGGRRLHNTNFLYDAQGNLEGTYVKQHLVPFGEYVPGRRFLEGVVDELEQIPRDHAPGGERRVFTVDGVALGNLICFESAFTEIARAYADDGAEVLLVSTNNRSFGRSANSAQHLAIGQMRAAETGRPVVQAAISGKSAFIDAGGDIAATTDLFERTTLVRSVTGRTGRTPYVALGDWVLLVAAAVLFGAALAAFRAERTGRFAPSRGDS